MNKLVFILSIIVMIVIILLIIGLFIPKKRSNTKEYVFDAEVDDVWNIVTELKKQEMWRNDVKEITVLDNTLNEEVWIEVSKNGSSIKFKTKDKVENKLWIMEFIDNSVFEGEWIGKFKVIDGGKTKVDFTETIVISNPYMRVMSGLFLDLDKMMSLYLKNLERELNKKEK